jgi:hypothetical protein
MVIHEPVFFHYKSRAGQKEVFNLEAKHFIYHISIITYNQITYRATNCSGCTEALELNDAAVLRSTAR